MHHLWVFFLQTTVNFYWKSLIAAESLIDADELQIRPNDYIQVNCPKSEVYEAFAGDNVSMEFEEETEDVATQKVQLTMPGEYQEYQTHLSYSVCDLIFKDVAC